MVRVGSMFFVISSWGFKGVLLFVVSAYVEQDSQK